MYAHVHSLRQLFAQLGLPDEPLQIDCFIHHHRPVPGQLRLAEAPFWNLAQSQLLTASVDDDADWAVVVDKLDTLLRR
jgi:hypothetical protein